MEGDFKELMKVLSKISLTNTHHMLLFFNLLNHSWNSCSLALHNYFLYNIQASRAPFKPNFRVEFLQNQFKPSLSINIKLLYFKI